MAGILLAQSVPPGAVVAGGQVGISPGQGYFVPVTVPKVAQSGVVALAVGSYWTLAAKDDGSIAVFVSGEGVRTSDGLIGEPFSIDAGPVKALACKISEYPWQEEAAILNPDGSVVLLDIMALPDFPVVPNTLKKGVIAIAYSDRDLLAATQDGRILRNGVVNPRDPVISGGIVALAGGYLGHALALTSKGAVVAWGDNQLGQTNVPVAARTEVVAIAAGAYHCLALKADGSVVAWGDDRYGQIDVPAAALSGVVAIAAGATHSLALRADGTVIKWPQSAPTDESTDDFETNLRGLHATAIAAGDDQDLAIVRPQAPVISVPPSNQVLNLGEPRSLHVGAAGYPLSYQWRRDSVDIPGANHADFPLKFARTGSYTVMVSNEVGSVTSTPPAIVVVAPPRPGTVVGWGWNDQGQTDVPATGFSGMVSIGAGDEYSIGARMDGSLVYWGFSPSGGDWPQRYAELKGVTGFGAGAPGLMILDESGLILNDTMIYNSPLSAWAGAIAAAAGDAHALVLKHDGSIVIWGENPMVTNVPSTLQSGVVGIAAGGAHTLALKADGSVVAWGSNSSGQTNVPSLARNDVTAIAAGAQHSLALRKDGMVVAWGDNQLGQGTVPALATSGVVAIAAGRYHSVALKADGTMVAWGDNSFGQLDVPEVIQGEVTGIAAGGKHTLAILNTATLQSRLTPAGLVLSWPTNLAGFHLQTASSLEAAAAWTEVPETLVVVGNRQMVTRPLAGAPQWYRLSR